MPKVAFKGINPVNKDAVVESIIQSIPNLSFENEVGEIVYVSGFIATGEDECSITTTDGASFKIKLEVR